MHGATIKIATLVLRGII